MTDIERASDGYPAHTELPGQFHFGRHASTNWIMPVFQSFEDRAVGTLVLWHAISFHWFCFPVFLEGRFPGDA